MNAGATMQNKFRGVMQSPVTPLKDDFSLDLPTFEKVLDFHVRSSAPAISWPHHKGESLNLTIPERKLFAEAAVRVVAGRVPVTIHVSALADRRCRQSTERRRCRRAAGDRDLRS
jgi:dihydrodipicolinate synthase/N-acetylneuraminate lyase